MGEKLYRRRRRRAYLDDFQINEDGTYEYAGGRYVYEGTDLQALKRTMSIQAGIMVFSVFLAGCLPAPGLTSPVVLIPYALSLAFSVAAGWSLIRLCKGGNPMRTYIYKETVLRLPTRALIAAGSAALALVGELVFVLYRGYMRGLLRAPGFFLSLTVTLIASALLYKSAKAMRWTPEKKQEERRSHA